MAGRPQHRKRPARGSGPAPNSPADAYGDDSQARSIHDVTAHSDALAGRPADGGTTPPPQATETPATEAPASAPRGAAGLTARRFVAQDLERLIYERTRLGIVSALAVNDSLSFAALKALLQTTDGNLSVHARKLEDAGYLSCRKYFEGRVPRTEYRLTASGRTALERHLEQMESLIHTLRKS